MILDKENTFFNKKALSASDLTSDIVQVGPGESGCPLHLVAAVTKDAGTGTLTTKLETSATPDFKSPKTLATYNAVPLAADVPRGSLGYLRLTVTSTYSKGTLTAGLVLDDDIDW